MITLPLTTTESFAAIERALRCKSFTFLDEVDLQDQLAVVLKPLHPEFAREWRLDRFNRADFRMFDNIAVEVKIKGALGNHLRQLQRYALFPCVTATLLIATRPFQAPATIAGKPCHYIKINRL